MSSQYIKGVIPTKRDLLLFDRLCQLGFLTPFHIHNLVFKDGEIRSNQNRLKRLKAENFISIFRRNDGRGSFFYVPNLEKIKPYVSLPSYEKATRAAQVHPWYLRTAAHEDCVRTVALQVLENFPEMYLELDFQLSGHDSTAAWKLETDKRKLPDIHLKSNNGFKFAIEIELTTKSFKRYLSIFESYLLTKRCGVLYIFKDKNTPPKLIKALNTLGLNSLESPFPLLTLSLEEGINSNILRRVFKELELKISSWETARAVQVLHNPKTKMKLSDILK